MPASILMGEKTVFLKKLTYICIKQLILKIKHVCYYVFNRI